eukprot:scaffold534668_cov31-Prasinocladus_malaysianus.AAC.1
MAAVRIRASHGQRQAARVRSSSRLHNYGVAAARTSTAGRRAIIRVLGTALGRCSRAPDRFPTALSPVTYGL